MSDKPSPFAGLDKALLRSTRPQEAPATADAPDSPTSSEPVMDPTPLAAEPPRAKARSGGKPAGKRTSRQASNETNEHASSDDNKQTNERDSILASEQVGNLASITASLLASKLAQDNADLIAAIRKSVRIPGKEVSFVRLTIEEKRQLADIVYTYKRQGKKTSENEINRIAINYVLEDYRANGEQSILASVIDALLA